MRLSNALAAGALALVTTAASAVPEYAGDHGVNPCHRSVQMKFYGAVASPVDYVYQFTLVGRHDVLVTAAVLEGLRGFQMRNAMVTLWRSNGDNDYLNDELVGGFDFTTLAVAQSFPFMPGGRYFWRIEGIADGDGGGLLMATAVSEPTTSCEGR